MAERKRGLGRGLGALIPDVVTDERPVDVFFPEGGEVSRETDRRKVTDPAAGMAQSRRDKKSGSGNSSRAGKRDTAKAATTTGGASDKDAAKEGKEDARADRDDSPAAKSPSKGSATKKASSTTGTSKRAAKPASRNSQDKKSSTKPARASQKAVVGADEPAGGSVASSDDFADVSRETDMVSVPGTAFGLLPIEEISANAKQPRTVFDEDSLEELVESIKNVGVLQPIVVRVTDPTAPAYELIMGERRLRASKEAGLSEIPAIIRNVSDDDMLRDALLENLHRADLNPLEEAAAYQQLLDDFQCTQEELSKRLGRSRPQITNCLRLLRLPSLVQRRVGAGVISQGHARALLGLNDGAAMEALAQRVVSEGLSVRATEEAVVLLNRGEKPRVSRETRQDNPELADIARSMGDRLDTRVNIVMGKRKGKISVEFANESDLDRILKTLGMQEK